MSSILEVTNTPRTPIVSLLLTYQPERTAKITEPELERGPNKLTHPGQSLVT